MSLSSTTFIVKVSLLIQRLVYRLDNQGLIPGMGNDGVFFLHHCIHTGSDAQPTSYPVDGGLFPGDKMAWA
jgi:hypothetical protein